MNIQKLKETIPGLEEKRIAAIRARFASGNYKRRDPAELAETAKKMTAGRLAMTPERRKEANQKISAAHIGKKGTGKGVEGPKNCHSLFWAVKHPTGVIIKGVNLRAMIQEHAHLFEPEDLILSAPDDQCSTRAYRGIRGLFKRSKASLSWHGWTAVTCREPDPLD